jgi:hypothetical protein
MQKQYTDRIAAGEITIKHITLAVERLRAQYSMDLCGMHCHPVNFDAHEIRDEVARRLILQIEAKVASKKYAVKTVRYPATWLEAFKERFIPNQWQHLWPVKYEEVTLEASAYYPEIEIPGREAFVEIRHAAMMRKYQ